MPPKQVKAEKRKSGGKPAKASPVKKAKKQVEESEDDESENDSEEEEKVAEVANGKGKKVTKQAPAKNDEEGSEESADEEEEAPKPVKKASKKANKKAAKKAAKQAAKKESSDDGSDDSEEETPEKAEPAAKEEEEDSEDESEEEEKPKAAKKAESAKPAKDEESSGEEASDDEDEEEEVAEKMDVDEDEGSKKRKKGEEKSDKAAKKAKLEVPKATEEEEKPTLFIGNMGDLEERNITKFFKKNDIEVAEVRMLGGKRCCFVDLSDASDMEKALELNGSDVKGNELTIQKPRKRDSGRDGGRDGDRSRGGGEDNRDATTLFVKNLPYEATEDGVRELFDGCTEVRMPKRDDGSIKGFAYIQFATTDEVKSAIEEKQGTDYDGRSLYLDLVGQSRGRPSFGDSGSRDRNTSKGEAGRTKVLFVKNLSYDTTGESLQDAFDGAKSARVAKFSDSGKSRGFGFVEFDSSEDCKAAFDKMQGEDVDGRQVILDFASELRDGAPRGDFRQGNWRGTPRGGRGGGRGFGGGGRGFGGRGRGGDRDRGGRGGRGGFRGGRGGGGFGEFKGRRKTFDD